MEKYQAGFRSHGGSWVIEPNPRGLEANNGEMVNLRLSAMRVAFHCTIHSR